MRTPAGIVAFYASTAVALLLFIAAALALALFVAMPRAADPLRALPQNPWWFVYHDPAADTTSGALWRIAAAIAGACIGSAAAFRSLTLFRRDPSHLHPFLMMFLFSLSLECLRAGTALLYAGDRSIAAAVVLTRIMYWGRFVGLLGLLLAGLYSIELKYRKYAVLVGVVFLVSFAMAAYIPIDRSVFLAQLTWKLGDEQGVWFVNLVIAILVIATSAGASFVRKDRRYFWLAGGLTLLLVSRELLFFGLTPGLLAAGLLALTLGITICLRTLLVISTRAEDSPAA
jgi:uncharacterized membrane protein (Fun14 family)